jgi:hypothetical protein
MRRSILLPERPSGWIPAASMVALLAAGMLQASVEYETTELVLRAHPEQTVTPVFMDGDIAQLLVASVDEDNNRTLAIYALQDQQWRSVVELPIGNDVYLYNVVKSGEAERVMLYRDGELCWLDLEGNLTVFASINSIYKAPLEEEFPAVNLTEDLNDDGLDDLLIPDFTGWRVATQRPDGEFSSPVLLGPGPFMGLSSERYVYFRARQAYRMDYDLDGLRDLAFWADKSFHVFRQQDDGHFSTRAEMFDPQVKFEHDGFFSLSIGEDADNPDERQSILYDVDDLNGDNLADVIVYAVEGEGIFGKQTSYDIHFGRRGSSGVLEFAPQPDTTVSSDGIQLEIERTDLDNDGTQEIIVTSVRFGFGAIVKALFTRSVSLDLSFYRMVDGVYPEQANVKRRISAHLDFSNGDMFVPAVFTADVTGDGMKDLLVQNGLEELQIFPGVPGEELFASRSLDLKLELPEDQDNIQVRDLDRNGADDLLILLEGPDDTTRVRVLFF